VSADNPPHNFGLAPGSQRECRRILAPLKRADAADNLSPAHQEIVDLIVDLIDFPAQIVEGKVVCHGVGLVLQV